MWVVAKIKNNQEKIFLNDLKNLKHNFEFYYPKMEINKNNQKQQFKNVLGNYVFCYSKNFKIKNFQLSLKFCKGLQHFIFGNDKDSIEIGKFINFCKKNENNKGFIANNFFFKLINDKTKIISGPLKNIFLDIHKVYNNKIFARSGIFKITINKNSDSVCYPL